MNIFEIRNVLATGKTIFDLELLVTFYARVSTDRDEQLNSLENQVMFFEKFIKEHTNWTYVEGYVDEGISGKSVNKRKNFLKMIDDAKKGKFNLILTKEVSRFARNTVDSIKYTQELLANNVGIYFLNDNINTFDSDSELRLTIMSSIAQDEIRKLSERVRFGYKRSIEKGVVPGSNNIYGYTKNNGKLVIDEKEAELIRLIFTEYSKDKLGTNKLGHYLYDEYGIKSKTGKPLAGTVLGRILRNPKYKGYYCAHKESTIDYLNQKRIRFKKEDWTVYKDNESCPLIVSEELWDICNEILNRNSRKHAQKTPTDRRYALSGKIKCFHDGATFVKGAFKTKNNGMYNFWGCSNYRKYGRTKEKGCQTPIIKYEEMVDVFKQILHYIFYNEESIIGDIQKYLKDVKNTKDYGKELEIINSQLKITENANMELIDMKARREINSQEYKQLKETYEKKIAYLNDKQREYTEKKDANDYTDAINDFREKIKGMLVDDPEAILRVGASIVDKIYVEKLPDTDNKTKNVMLHFKLNILGHQTDDLNFDDFLLLFSNSDRCGGGSC